MVTLIDNFPARPRHPEKVNRPETIVLRKPDWIRVKAPSGRISRALPWRTTRLANSH